jgi:hypothetical protein
MVSATTSGGTGGPEAPLAGGGTPAAAASWSTRKPGGRAGLSAGTRRGIAFVSSLFACASRVRSASRPVRAFSVARAVARVSSRASARGVHLGAKFVPLGDRAAYPLHPREEGNSKHEHGTDAEPREGRPHQRSAPSSHAMPRPVTRHTRPNPTGVSVVMSPSEAAAAAPRWRASWPSRTGGSARRTAQATRGRPGSPRRLQ